jgi:hypothetical protein
MCRLYRANGKNECTEVLRKLDVCIRSPCESRYFVPRFVPLLLERSSPYGNQNHKTEQQRYANDPNQRPLARRKRIELLCLCDVTCRNNTNAPEQDHQHAGLP